MRPMPTRRSLLQARSWNALLDQGPMLRFQHRAALSMVIFPALVTGATVYLLTLASLVTDRAHLVEAIGMLGRARKDLTVELALRPASVAEAPGNAAEQPQPWPTSKHNPLSIRYARQGDRLLAHFEAGGSSGLWILESVEPGSGEAWALNWRCTSRSSGRFTRVAQTLCPGAPTDSQP